MANSFTLLVVLLSGTWHCDCRLFHFLVAPAKGHSRGNRLQRASLFLQLPQVDLLQSALAGTAVLVGSWV